MIFRYGEFDLAITELKLSMKRQQKSLCTMLIQICGALKKTENELDQMIRRKKRRDHNNPDSQN